MLMVSHAIKEASSGQRIKVISDDTHVLVFLAHRSFNNTKGMAEVESFTIDSTHSSANCINVKEVAKEHASIMPNLLAAHSDRLRYSVVFFWHWKVDHIVKT